jgi:hypothetical protein
LNKTNLLATISIWSINDWQEDGQVVCNGGVVHLGASVAVERENGEVSKVAPVAMKVAIPITQDAIDDGAQVELCAESVKHGAAVDARDGERSLVSLKRVSALGGKHGQVHHRVELDGEFVHLDGLEGPRDEH